MNLKILKQIPRSDVPLDERVRLKNDRARRYPDIEVIDPDETGSLSAAPRDPTDEELWGDPVNLLYPLAETGQTAPDRNRANNARARFVQFANSQYQDRQSKATVYERIVRAQLAAGTMAPSFDPTNNEFDRLLPADLRAELTRRLAKGDMMSFDKALKNYTDVVKNGPGSESNSDPTPAELLDTALKTLDGVAGVEKAVEAIVLAKGLLHVPGAGSPESVGLSLNDVSGNENYSPINPTGVTNRFETRSMGNPLPSPGLEGAFAESQATIDDSPILGDMPGPRVPEPNEIPDPAFQIPQPHLPANSRFNATGVSKGSLSDYLAKLISK
jgi:hypothetical protein